MRVMTELQTLFHLGLSDYDHIEWLVQTGLVSGLHGVIQAAETVGSARKAEKDFTVTLKETTQAAASLSLAASSPPASWLSMPPGHDANARGGLGQQSLQSPRPSRTFLSPAREPSHILDALVA